MSRRVGRWDLILAIAIVAGAAAMLNFLSWAGIGEWSGEVGAYGIGSSLVLFVFLAIIGAWLFAPLFVWRPATPRGAVVRLAAGLVLSSLAAIQIGAGPTYSTANMIASVEVAIALDLALVLVAFGLGAIRARRAR